MSLDIKITDYVKGNVQLLSSVTDKLEQYLISQKLSSRITNAEDHSLNINISWE
jgi:hypothetical protein